VNDEILHHRFIDYGSFGVADFHLGHIVGIKVSLLVRCYSLCCQIYLLLCAAYFNESQDAQIFEIYE
jgi:hypothetical protein